MAPHPPTRSREIPGGAAAIKIGCGVVSLVFVGSVALAVSVLTSGCGEAKEVLRSFRDGVKAGKLAQLSMKQADDATTLEAVASSTDTSVSGFELVTSGEDWICVHGSISTPSGSKDLDVLAHRNGKAPWVVAGASLTLQCRIKRGGPRFIKR